MFIMGERADCGRHLDVSSDGTLKLTHPGGRSGDFVAGQDLEHGDVVETCGNSSVVMKRATTPAAAYTQVTKTEIVISTEIEIVGVGYLDPKPDMTPVESVRVFQLLLAAQAAGRSMAVITSLEAQGRSFRRFVEAHGLQRHFREA
jgi:hypothetical protein